MNVYAKCNKNAIKAHIYSLSDLDLSLELP